MIEYQSILVDIELVIRKRTCHVVIYDIGNENARVEFALGGAKLVPIDWQWNHIVG